MGAIPLRQTTTTTITTTITTREYAKNMQGATILCVV